MKISSLLFGTAGIPIITEPRNTINGIVQVHDLGLNAMELEFVHNINISDKMSPIVKKTAISNNVVLTCHGSYYINLNSLDKTKINASIERIINNANAAWACGAWSLVFHAAYYMKMNKEVVYKNVRASLTKIVESLKKNKNEIWIRPEVTGKPTQFGTLDEILNLSLDVDNVMPCIDFAHYHARTNGKYNTYDEFSEILSNVEKKLGKKGLKNMHIHVSGIAYNSKGERHHLVLKESDFNYKDLLRVLKEFKVKGVLICESPNIESDAILMQRWYNEI